MSELWLFLGGMAVVLWGHAIIWYLMADWKDRRSHERREDVWNRIEEGDWEQGSWP